MYKFFVAWIMAACLAVSAGAAETPELQPDFTLPVLWADQEVSLSDFRGHWVVVNYWATWCDPCKKEVPELSELHTALDDVTVLGLAYEDSEDANFEAFIEEFKPSYPILLPDVYAMPEGLEAPRVLPITFIVNPEGIKIRTFFGPVTRKDLEETIDAAREEL